MDVALTVLLTVTVALAAGLTAGFVVLFRRGRRAGPQLHAMRSGAPIARADPAGDATQQANILLVRADDAVRDARDELDFAIAQFGEDRTRNLSAAVDSAQRQVMEAFELQQRLDDAVPDTETQRRDWTARISHLCNSATSELSAELARIADLRRRERTAPDALERVRRRIDELSAQHASAERVLAELRREHSAEAIASVADSLDRATQELAAARTAGDEASALLDDDAAGSVQALEALRESEDHTGRAAHLLDSIEALHAQLAAAAKALESRIQSTRANLADAQALQASATDATATVAVIDAISVVQSTLATLDGGNPVDALDRLQHANQTLDLAMAGARNQEQRLAQAREALAGALVAARSQVSTTRDYVNGRRGGVGTQARTRLAEAERLLTVAQAEADPVLALDTARSAATYARDADALARWDLQSR